MNNIYIKGFAILSPLIISRCSPGARDIVDDRPNILIAIGDDISFPHMSAFGCEFVNTPGFDRVARGGILFNNAYTPNAKSSPSRACLLTGRNSWQLEEACNHIPHFPARFKTFIESLNDHGYFTGFTAKGWAPGVALDSSGRNRQMTGKAFNSRKTIPPAAGIRETETGMQPVEGKSFTEIFYSRKNGIVDKTRDQLEKELTAQRDPRILGNGDVFDKYHYADESGRDFYNRYMRGELLRKSAGWIDSTDFETILPQ